MVSPLLGASGNTEFFVHCRRGIDLSTQLVSIDQVVEEAERAGTP